MLSDSNKKRFIRALSEAVDELTANAKCYGYKNEPEFVAIVSQMRACRDNIRTALQANENKFLQEQMDVLKAYGIDFPIDEILKKDIVAFVNAKQSGKALLDCEAAEIDGDIRACLNAGTLTKEQADFLYAAFVHSW